MIRTGRCHVPGGAHARAIVLAEPLSFWGGVDGATGTIVDRTHPALGTCLTGLVLVMPAGRGSSSSSSVLAEMIRLGVGPVAIVLERPDPIITTGALVAFELYGLRCPVVTCDITGIATGDHVRIRMGADGDAEVEIEVGS